MSRRSPGKAWRRVVMLLSLAILVGYATAPLVDVGFVGDDFASLAEASDLVRSTSQGEREVRVPFVERLYAVEGTEGRPLAGLSILASWWLWSADGVWSPIAPRALRLENLGLLLLAAWGVSCLVRRLLAPWTGSDQAAAAGLASGLLLVLHPLSLAAVGDMSSRGEFLAASLGAVAGATFLRGRQERAYGLTVVAAVLTALAGLAAEVAFGLPLLLAAAEYLSSHRYRPRHVRLRTATTTLLVFGACAGIDGVLRSTLVGGPLAPGWVVELARLFEPGQASRSLALFVEKLGVLVLPVNSHGIGGVGYLLAGGLILFGLQPALLASRSAPRMWGSILFLWCVLLVATAIPALGERVHPRDFSAARALFPSVAVMAVGLGASSTALTGLRRHLLPWAMALGYAVLGHANAQPVADAAREVDRLRAELSAARELFGRDARLLVVDPPRLVRGTEAIGDSLDWLLHPAFTGRDEGEGPSWVRGLELEAFFALVREREFGDLRARSDGSLVLLVSGELLAEPGGPRIEPGRVGVELPPPAPTSGRRLWYAGVGSGVLDLEALTTGAMVVSAVEKADSGLRPRMRWSARNPLVAGGTLDGAWVRGPDDVSASFDLGRSLRWLLGQRVRLVQSERGWEAFGEARVLEEPPSLGTGVLPRGEGPDWIFPAPPAPEVEAATARGRWVLVLLDPWTFAHAELLGSAAGDGTVRVRGAAARVARMAREGSGKVAWSLDLRVDDVTVARARGRRHGRDGALEESER